MYKLGYCTNFAVSKIIYALWRPSYRVGCTTRCILDVIQPIMSKWGLINYLPIVEHIGQVNISLCLKTHTVLDRGTVVTIEIDEMVYHPLYNSCKI